MITIYDAKAADFSTLGLGALLPTKCTVSEMAGGMYEMKIVHPITSDMRHDRIKPMRIIKAPAPVRETPQVEIGQSGSVTRSIYKVVTDGRRLYLRVKPDQESKGLHAYKPGTEVATVELSADGKWRRVIILDGGATGWMWAGNLEYVRTETEIITGDAPGTIIRPRQTREQLFRVYFYSPDTKTRTITAEARHITYDLVGAIVDGEYSPENVPADQVCAQIMAKADHDISDFHIYCTITDPISGDYGGRNILDCLLDPETGVVAQTKARVIRDNYDIFILPDEARNRGVELRYGKNLLAAHMDADTSDTITRIKPVGKDKNGEKLYIAENGGWVESPYINDYPVIHSKEVEYDVVESDNLPINQARALLKDKAEADFAAGCDMASVKLDADFVRLELTEDYKHLANAYALHLYDSVPVIDREADIVATARMTQYVYDAILDEYSDTGLGELNEVKSTIYGYEIAQGTVSGGKLIPNTVNGDRLQNLSVSYGKFDLAAINQLSANAITAIRADIRELVAGNITTDQLYADLAVIAAAQITAANIEKANIQWAEIENLAVEIAKVVNAEIKHAKIDWAQIENAEIDAADIKNLSASIATIVKAEIALAEIDWAQIKNAEIDTAQIKLGAITQALIAAGAIGTAQIADGSITEAKVVSLNADVIKTGTLSVERLLLKGANGLFYAINATAGGLTSTQLTQEQYKNAISGTALVARSVTADKIAAKSITANEILSGTITAAEINVSNLFAAAATIAALDSYIVRTSTIEALKGSLDIWASDKIRAEVSNSVSGLETRLEMTEEEVLLQAGRTVGGRNYLLNSKGPYTVTGASSERYLFPWPCASQEEATSLYGRTVTVSLDYEAAITSGSLPLRTYDTWQVIAEFNSNTKNGHISKTINVANATARDANFLYIRGTWTGSITFSNVKVETGDYATDWSPHPDDPASGVDAGGVVRVDQTGVHMSGGEIEMETSDGDEYIHIRSDGVSASSLSAPNVAPRYDGPSVLYVNPSATSAQIAAGNYFRSLADALAKLDRRWVGYEVTINLAAGMTEYGTPGLAGVSGGGKIIIQGSSSNRAKLVGGLILDHNASRIAVMNLNVDLTGTAGILSKGDADVYIQYCTITGTGASGSRGIHSRDGACVLADNCEIYDCERSLYGELCGVINGNSCKGNGRVGANRTTLYLVGTMPCDSTTWTASTWAGQVLTSSVTVDQGSKPTAEPAPVTAYYSYTGSDSYAGAWGKPDTDISQGFIRTDNAGNTAVIYGTIWFDAAAIKSALSGKTVKQASIRLFMRKNFGRGDTVSVQLYGTNMAYSGRSGAPGLTTSYGTIGTTEPGEVNEITIPAAVISDMVSGKIVGLVLKSDDTALHKDRDYSRNYARFAGSGTATADTCPRLTVVYR